MNKFVRINDLPCCLAANQYGVIVASPNHWGWDVTIALSGSPHTPAVGYVDHWGFNYDEFTILGGAQ